MAAGFGLPGLKPEACSRKPQRNPDWISASNRSILVMFDPMFLRRSLIALFTAVAVLTSSAVFATAPVSTGDGMACCAKVHASCHHPRPTMSCCPASAPIEQRSLPSSPNRLERPVMSVVAALDPAAISLGSPSMAGLAWSRAPAFTSDVSPYLLHKVFRI